MRWVEKHRQRAAQGEQGQALVEFAVAIPIFLLLVLGAIEFGRAAFIMTTLQNAAREGARYAVIAPNDTYGIGRAARHTVVLPDSRSMNVQIAFPSGTSAPADPVSVTVTYRFRFLFPLVSDLFSPAGMPLNYSAQMDIE